MKKPEYNGVMHGQCVTQAVRKPKLRPDGRIARRPWAQPDGQVVWVAIKIVVQQVEWMWDNHSKEWLSPFEWNNKYPCKPANKVLASKHSDLHIMLAERQRRRSK